MTGITFALLLRTTKGKETFFKAYELQFIELNVKQATIASPDVKPDVNDSPEARIMMPETPMAIAY